MATTHDRIHSAEDSCTCREGATVNGQESPLCSCVVLIEESADALSAPTVLEAEIQSDTIAADPVLTRLNVQCRILSAIFAHILTSTSASCASPSSGVTPK